VVGASDASVLGMGGFCAPTTLLPHTTPPILWHHRFSAHITTQLKTRDNLTGTLSINNLELAALIQAYSIVAHQIPTLMHGTMLCATDNATANAWVTNGSKPTDKAPAHLLATLATLAWSTNCNFESILTAGASNTLADFCSCSFHLSDAQFLAYINMHWPMQTFWKLAHPNTDMVLQWSSALSRQTAKLASAPLVPMPMTTRGSCGPSSAPVSTKTNSSPTTLTQSLCSNSSLDIIGLAHSLPPTLQSAVERWKAPYAPLDRRLPHWAKKIPGCNPVENSTSGCNGS
jgi:hypothetical protein